MNKPETNLLSISCLCLRIVVASRIVTGTISHFAIAQKSKTKTNKSKNKKKKNTNY